MTTCFTPMKSAAARCSSARFFASSAGVKERSAVPASPLVHSTYVTSQPRAIHLATTPPDPISASSGWAKMTIALSGTSVTISSFRSLSGCTPGFYRDNPLVSKSGRLSRVCGLVIVLTLPVNEEEGHRPYLSQSAYPAKGTTVGGRTDDPRRERTRDALARHRARAGAGQRQRGVPRAGDLADRLLSLAQPAGTLRGRRRAPAPAARPGGAPGGDGARSGAAGARDRDQRGHLGLPTDRGLPRPDLAGALGAQHGAAAAAPGRAGHPARATDGARAAGGADGGTADGTYSPTPVARPLRPHAARRGERAGRARVSGHVLHRQPQRRRQSLADHGVRCGHFVRAGRPAARPRCGGRSHVPARGGRPPLPARGVADAPRPHRWRARVQGGV